MGERTASGERYDPNGMTAAHKTLPLGTRVRVTRARRRRRSIVRVNDRCGCTHGRIIDVSEAAARKLDMIRVGVVKVPHRGRSHASERALRDLLCRRVTFRIGPVIAKPIASSSPRRRSRRARRR